MGTTTKIIFGSVIALSVALMFLIFSMQKSAQLTLDLEDVKHTVQKKEQTIAVIEKNLAAAEAATESANAKSAVIPRLQNKIDTAEKEKGAYEQQINGLQGQLQKADEQLAEYSALQQEFKNHQIFLADAKKATVLAEEKTVQTSEALNAVQEELGQRDEQLNQSIAELEQKDRVIQVYKEKLDKSAEEISLLQEKDSSERLNLNLILDELAVKTSMVEELANRIIKLGGSADVSGTLLDENGNVIVAQEGDQAVIEQLTLENDSLKEKIGDQAILVHDLKTEVKNLKDLLAAAQTEIEQLTTGAQAMTEEFNALRLLEQNNQQELFQLKNDFDSKEKELIATQENSDKLSASLTEKIAMLETQLAYFSENKDETLVELNETKENIAGLQKENDDLVTALADTQISLEEALKEKGQLENNFQTSQSALKQEQVDYQALLASEIEPFKVALDNSEKRFNALNELHHKMENDLEELRNEKSQQEDLAIQLAAVQTVLQGAQEQNIQSGKANNTLKSEIERLEATVADQNNAIEQLTMQLTENKAQLAELENNVSNQENVPAVTEADVAEQEERIARLIEEVAAAKTLAEEQTAALNAREEELAALKEEAAANAALEEEKKKKLEATLNESQTELNNDQEKIVALESALNAVEAERDQLLLYTVDSDSDGISDADDKCENTVQGAAVNQQGCEEDNDQDGLVNRLDLCPETPSGSSTDNAGCSSEQRTIILEGVTFQLGTSKLTPNAQSALKHAAIILVNNPDINMEIAGHTDSIGQADSNLKLSTRRAQSVLNYLVSQGVDENRLKAIGYGSDEPIGDNNTNSGRALNRRVELRRVERGE